MKESFRKRITVVSLIEQWIGYTAWSAIVLIVTVVFVSHCH